MTQHQWRQMITLYTMKTFTRQTDILPALAGISNRIKGDVYHGGLWNSTFAQDLAWVTMSRPKRPPTRPKEYVAPSFLWASVVGTVEFLDISSSMSQQFSIENITLKGKHEELLGELCSGLLLLRGRVREAKFLHCFERPMPTNPFLPSITRGTSCMWATMIIPDKGHYIFHPDASTLPLIPTGSKSCSFQEGMNLFCMELFESVQQADHTCYSLVLVDSGWRMDGKTLYQRVGVTTDVQADLFRNVDENEIALV